MQELSKKIIVVMPGETARKRGTQRNIALYAPGIINNVAVSIRDEYGNISLSHIDTSIDLESLKQEVAWMKGKYTVDIIRNDNVITLNQVLYVQKWINDNIGITYNSKGVTNAEFRSIRRTVSTGVFIRKKSLKELWGQQVVDLYGIQLIKRMKGVSRFYKHDIKEVCTMLLSFGHTRETITRCLTKRLPDQWYQDLLEKIREKMSQENNPVRRYLIEDGGHVKNSQVRLYHQELYAMLTEKKKDLTLVFDAANGWVDMNSMFHLPANLMAVAAKLLEAHKKGMDVEALFREEYIKLNPGDSERLPMHYTFSSQVIERIYIYEKDMSVEGSVVYEGGPKSSNVTLSLA